MKHDKILEKVINLFKEIEKDKKLNEQFEHAKMKEIETECGFYVNFLKIPETMKKEKNLKLDYIYGNYEKNKPAVGFIIYMEKGKIKMLEAYTFGNADWPEDDEKIELFVQK